MIHPKKNMSSFLARGYDFITTSLIIMKKKGEKNITNSIAHLHYLVTDIAGH